MIAYVTLIANVSIKDLRSFYEIELVTKLIHWLFVYFFIYPIYFVIGIVSYIYLLPVFFEVVLWLLEASTPFYDCIKNIIVHLSAFLYNSYKELSTLMLILLKSSVILLEKLYKISCSILNTSTNALSRESTRLLSFLKKKKVYKVLIVVVALFFTIFILVSIYYVYIDCFISYLHTLLLENSKNSNALISTIKELKREEYELTKKVNKLPDLTVRYYGTLTDQAVSQINRRK